MSQDYRPWIGRQRESHDVLDPARPTALMAAIGRPITLATGAAMPQLMHWLYFWDVPPPSGTGPDGHPLRGEFLPPIAAPRRMWAGGRLTFHAPLKVGEAVRRVTTITDVKVKEGRTGTLTFVTLTHDLHGSAGLAISEQQDLVYREAAPASPTSPSPAPAPAAPTLVESDWTQVVQPDPVLLFRYSALTMNSHRIHYDRPYATGEEGYADLVVQGPLQATLMLTCAVARAGAPATSFRFRGLSPAMSGREIDVRGRGEELWVEQAGVRTMDGAVTFGAVA